ncbi:MAG: uroporphyrinogen-III C-methyltransferase [candidate division Zixibacteria bacterium]|nr:uroporphyrinogen-III C-methyltransferase [candidate division Zixibacteria bacterium]
MAEVSDKIGMIYLVGAGPGDPELITIRGARLLGGCDAVVYDNLIPNELIVMLPANVERHYVGKKASLHSLPQDQINQMLVDLARAGKNVVRLKGGDPFVFGRGGEEAIFLNDNGIPFEIVPGVTSGIAGPAYAGIPCTDRDHASSVTFLTGHKAADKDKTDVDWEWVAQAKHTTLVIYMGVNELEQNVEKLIANGLASDTPAAVIERGTLSSQRVLVTKLYQLATRCKTAQIRPPALFVIGEVARMHEKLTWFQKKPLSGLRVMVCRPADQAGWVYQSLRDFGAEVIVLPTIATTEHHDSAVWDKLRNLKATNRWLVFSSENGVRYFMRQWREQIGDVRKMADYRVAAVGFGTARALGVHAIEPDFIPSKATTVEFAKQMADQLDFKDATVVRVRGNLGDDLVEKTIADTGAEVIPLRTYDTFFADWSDEAKEKLLAYPPDVILFTSGSTAEGFAAHLSGESLKQVTEHAFVVSIGPSTSKTIKFHGMSVDLEAQTHSIPAMIDELVACHQKNPIGRKK